MKLLQILLGLIFVNMFVFTWIAIANDGWNLIPTVIENALAMGWSLQFNIDFASYLVLSALWVMWRHQFSFNGIVLGAVASVAGILFFAPYLMYAIKQSGGDMRTVLLGANRES